MSPFFEKILTGLLAVIAALIGVAYWGIDARLKSLEDHFQTAIVAGVEVRELLMKSPTLEQKITDTHDAVIRIQEGQVQITKLQDVQAQIINEQLSVMQSMQMDQQKMRIQLNNMQKQIHTIPGIEP